MVTFGPIFYGCIIEVHNTLAVCTVGPNNKVALLERLAAIEVPLYTHGLGNEAKKYTLASFTLLIL